MAESLQFRVASTSPLKDSSYSYVSRGIVSATITGHLFTHLAVFKIALRYESMGELQVEADTYQELQEMQGNGIPVFHGIFSGGVLMKGYNTRFKLSCILISDCGQSIESLKQYKSV